VQTNLLIDGDLEPGRGEGLAVLDPRTGTTLDTVAEADPGQIERAVTAAGATFDAWSRTTPAERAGRLLRLADRIEADAEAIADAECANTGKPRHAFLGDEIPAIADCFRFFAGACRTGTPSASACARSASRSSPIRATIGSSSDSSLLARE